MGELLPHYPERNPWELQDGLFNLTPHPPIDIYDTQAFRDAARDIAEKSHINPLYRSYGPNPFSPRDERLLGLELPLSAYEKPAPLNQAELTNKIVFLKDINSEGNILVFKACIGNDVRLLKVVRGNHCFRVRHDLIAS